MEIKWVIVVVYNGGAAASHYSYREDEEFLKSLREFHQTHPSAVILAFPR